jgi:hypothetical protein
MMHQDYDSEIPREYLVEFERAARRSMKERFQCGFIYTYKPVLDDARFRSFDSMAEYRAWCRENLPEWLGYWPADSKVPQ